MDAFSRLLLAVIAILLFVLVLGQLGVLRPPAAPQTSGSELSLTGGASSAEAGSTGDGARFKLTPIKVSPQSFFLLRMDQQTGRTWKVNFPSTSSGWQEVLEGEEVRERREAREAERKAKQEAAERAETP
jgi:hypothetical protein